VTPSTRFSQSAWNRMLSSSGTTGRSRGARRHPAGRSCAAPVPAVAADHAVPRDQRGKRLRVHPFGAGTDVRGSRGSGPRPWNPRHGCAWSRAASHRTPPARARLAHGPRAVVGGLVPGGRQAEDRPRVAGTERADDEVVLLGPLNTATICSPCRPMKPMEAMAAVASASASRRSRDRSRRAPPPRRRSGGRHRVRRCR
jgi:hypothetical protein